MGIAMIELLAKRLSELASVVQIDTNHPLSILCFRYQDDTKSDEINEQINVQTIRTIESEGRIFITVTRLYGKTYLRVYLGNPERANEDVNYIADVMAKTLKSAQV